MQPVEMNPDEEAYQDLALAPAEGDAAAEQQQSPENEDVDQEHDEQDVPWEKRYNDVRAYANRTQNENQALRQALENARQSLAAVGVTLDSDGRLIPPGAPQAEQPTEDIFETITDPQKLERFIIERTAKYTEPLFNMLLNEKAQTVAAMIPPECSEEDRAWIAQFIQSRLANETPQRLATTNLVEDTAAMAMTYLNLNKARAGQPQLQIPTPMPQPQLSSPAMPTPPAQTPPMPPQQQQQRQPVAPMTTPGGAPQPNPIPDEFRIVGRPEDMMRMRKLAELAGVTVEEYQRMFAEMQKKKRGVI